MRIEKIMAVVESRSLVTVANYRPVKFGNYFDFVGGIRCVNMWYENLDDLLKKKILNDGLIEIAIFQSPDHKDLQWGIVTDKRVPLNYLYNKLCFIGCPKPTFNIAKEMYSIHGDPSNEIEQYSKNLNEEWSIATAKTVTYVDNPESLKTNTSGQ